MQGAISSRILCLLKLLLDKFRFVIGLTGSGFIILLLENVYSIAKKGNIMNTFLYIGRQTMGIYIIQEYINLRFLMRITRNFHGINYGIAAAETIVIITLCLSCIYLLQKNGITKRLFTGVKHNKTHNSTHI